MQHFAAVCAERAGMAGMRSQPDVLAASKHFIDEQHVRRYRAAGCIQ